jgi:hypothetical protein
MERGVHYYKSSVLSRFLLIILTRVAHCHLSTGYINSPSNVTWQAGRSQALTFTCGFLVFKILPIYQKFLKRLIHVDRTTFGQFLATFLLPLPLALRWVALTCLSRPDIAAEVTTFGHIMVTTFGHDFWSTLGQLLATFLLPLPPVLRRVALTCLSRANNAAEVTTFGQLLVNSWSRLLVNSWSTLGHILASAPTRTAAGGFDVSEQSEQRRGGHPRDTPCVGQTHRPQGHELLLLLEAEAADGVVV